MPAQARVLRRLARTASLAALALLVAACAGTRGGGSSGSSGGGGYYMDDGPGSAEPADIAAIADAVPRDEPIRIANSRPYEVFGQRYVPMSARTPYREVGIASWYGRKFHGNATASGEPYDMYAMTAAHRTLPLPSYVRVTNLSNQRSVVVRVNDRGPFMKNRLIDLSWTAAKKLGFIEQGHARVLVELVLPGEGPAAQEEPIAAAPPAEVPPRVPPRVPPGFVLVGSSSGPAAAAATTANEAPSPTGGFVRVDAPPAGGFVGVPAEASRTSGFVPVDASPTASVHASAATPVDAPTPPVPSVPPATAHFLQLGAFESRDGALAALSDLGRRLDWLGDTLAIHPENGQFKIHAGPWPDAIQARRVAERIRAETRIEAFSVRREADR